MKSKLDELTEEYTQALQTYLQNGSEGGRKTAYEIGRRALGEGIGVLEMIALHFRAELEALARIPGCEGTAVGIKKAGEFLGECMSPYEMTHRAYGEANEALRRLNTILEEEVRRIARELHDEAGQLLAVVYLRLDEVAREFSGAQAARIMEVRNLLDQIESQLRRLAHELRPTVLDDLGLGPALQFLAEGISRRAKISIHVNVANTPRFPGMVETALYRIVQEALTNAAKHARAHRVEVRIEAVGASVSCSVRDDGIGLRTPAAAKGSQHGIGLAGIRERINSLGGSVQITSAPGSGTELQISLPIGAQNASSSSHRR